MYGWLPSQGDYSYIKLLYRAFTIFKIIFVLWNIEYLRNSLFIFICQLNSRKDRFTSFYQQSHLNRKDKKKLLTVDVQYEHKDFVEIKK